MKTTNQQFKSSHRIIIETDEYILPIQMERIQYVVVTSNHELDLHGFDVSYYVSDPSNLTLKKLLKAGFIQIGKNTYVQPKQIAEYNIKSQKIVLVGGKTLTIQPNCIENLNNYFAKIH